MKAQYAILRFAKYKGDRRSGISKRTMNAQKGNTPAIRM